MSLENRLTDVVTVIGNDIKEVVGRLDGTGSPATVLPSSVGSTSAMGTSTARYALEDHVHDGVSSVSINGGAQQKGDVSITIPSPYTDEQAQEASAVMLVNATHSGVSVAYNDESSALAITNTDKGSTAVSAHVNSADPHPQYITASEAPSVQSAVLTATQANSTTTEQTLTGHTFTIPPGKAAVITGNLIFTSAGTTAGAFYGVLVTQGTGANGNAVGSWMAYVNISSAATATGLSDGDAFNLAGGASTPTGAGVLGTATVAGNNSATLNCMVKNNSTNVDTTVRIRFRSEVAGKDVTAQIGTMAVCVVS